MRTQRRNAAEDAADPATVGEDPGDASSSRRSADESPAPPPRAEREAGWGPVAAGPDGSCSFRGVQRDKALRSLQPAPASCELILRAGYLGRTQRLEKLCGGKSEYKGKAN